MGIEFKRKFTLDSNGVYKAINDDIYISLYDEKIKLPLSRIRDVIKYFPIKKDAVLDFKASNPLLTIIKKDNTYVIQYGNRRLSRLKADYQEYDDDTKSVEIQIDGKLQDVKFGSLIDVEDNFLVKENSRYRVNVIGYTNNKKKETGIEIKNKEIPERFSLDKKGTIYRVEYYTKNKFAGMVLIKFRT